MKNSLFLCLIFFITPYFSQDFKKIIKFESCKNEIEKKLSSTKTLSANFNELVYSSMLKEPSKGKGIIKYKAKDKIRWEHLSPKSRIILMQGGKVKMQENGKVISNPTSNKIASKIQGLMTNMLTGKILGDKNMKITYYESTSQYKLVITPSGRMAKYIASMELIFDKKTLELAQMILKESEKESIEYQFTDVKLNQEINDLSFTKF